MSAIVYYRRYELPWSPSEEGERRFRLLVRNLFIGYAVFAVLIPFLPVQERDRSQPQELPERVVRLILEQPKLVPPPPPPAPEPEAKPEPVVKKETPKPVEQPKPVELPKAVDTAAEARKKAARSGLLAFQDELADLRDEKIVDRFARDQVISGAMTDAPRIERALITSRAGKSSGGINTATMSRSTGGSGLRARGTTEVSSTVARLGGVSEPAPGTAESRAGRSREEIEMVFDQNKGAIFALYNRALRENPALQGKLVLKLTIESSGEVSACEVVSSELSDEELERKLVQRVRMFRFVAKDVPSITTTKPIEFFPA